MPAGDGAAAARAARSSPCPRRAANWSISGRSSRRPGATLPGRAPARGPRGAWTARFASLIHDDPRALHWDTAGVLVVGYGFHTYALETATGALRWEHRSATPIVALLGSPRLAHVIVQSEIETFAIEPDGAVAWRIAHSDVVTAADLLGGRLVLTSFDGQATALDPATGRTDAADGRHLWTDCG